MNKQLSLKQIIITVVIFLIVYIFIVSNYRFKMTDSSQYTTEMVTMGKMTGRIALDFKFLGKHIIVIKK